MWQFWIIALLSLFLLVSYFVIPLFFPGIPLSNLWGGVQEKHLRWVYTVSMLLCAVSYLLVFTYSWNHMSASLLSAFCGFLFFSMLWMPFMYLSLQHPSNTGLKALMILTLFAIACFALWIVFAVRDLQDPRYEAWYGVALAGAVYLFLHTFLLDFMVFSTAYVV